MSDIKLWQGDCLELMKDIPDKSVDMIFTDLPYGTTNCRWDSIIPLEDYHTTSEILHLYYKGNTKKEQNVRFFIFHIDNLENMCYTICDIN